MPLAGSCSAALSAACHDSSGDLEVSLKPIQWRAVPNSDDGPGNFCFTSRAVEPPVVG